jgi:predicted DNA binding CopG/RHH family protein
MTMPNKTAPLDQEEQDLLDALEQLDAKALPPVPSERQQLFREAAASFVSRETHLSISMDALDMEELHKRAASRGIRCQSFVKDILHKYLTGQLLEKNAY